MYSNILGRRQFLSTTTAITAATWWASPMSRRLLASEPADLPWLRKTLKVGMVGGGGSMLEKFTLAKAAGFEGIELNVPGNSVAEAVDAAKQTQLIIDGTVGGYHWKVRHTDPDPSVRAKAQAKLESGLRETAALGGDTMLLVPGHGKDGTEQEVLERATKAITEALPIAKEAGVAIVIENVWNEMFYDPKGGNQQSADELAKFVDSFESPLVGVQFDIGNHWKFGDPADWIRTLGHRIFKLDIKGFSRKTGKFTDITEGDIDWNSVEAALHEIKFTGWLAAEVGGGNSDRLKKIHDQLDKALHCSDQPSVVEN